MKISRIALASLISFGVLGGASLNASASHHSHYNKVLWNKPMAHKKVTLKNGKGIIWNKPFKTAKNAKIKYRISHKKGLVLTTIRHMKVKNGTIYYFVKAGKVTGWINKSSIKLVKATASKTVTEPTRTTPAPQAPKTTTPSTQQGSTANANKSSQSNANGTVTQGSAGSLGTLPSTSSNPSTDSKDPFSTYAEGTVSNTDGAWVYHQKVNGDKVTDKALAFRLDKGAKVIAALNTDQANKDTHSNKDLVLIKTQTQYGYVYGYVKRSDIQFGTDSDTAQVANTDTASSLNADGDSPLQVKIYAANQGVDYDAVQKAKKSGVVTKSDVDKFKSNSVTTPATTPAVTPSNSKMDKATAKYAYSKGITINDLKNVHGSGTNGQVTKTDIDKIAATQNN